MNEPVFTEDQKAEIKRLVHEALSEFFSGYGRSTKGIIVGTAVVIGSITVILGGVKLLLTWVGFSYLGR